MSEKNRDHSLPERLRDEAIAERPAFSAETHRQIMRRINDRPSPNRLLVIRIPLAAAAILLLGLTLYVFHFRRDHGDFAGQRPTAIAVTTPPAADLHRTPTPQISLPITLNIGGVLAATFEPADVTLKLSILDQGNSREADVPASSDNPAPTLASPEWLFAALAEPASRAQAAIADVVPFDFRAATRLPPAGH